MITRRFVLAAIGTRGDLHPLLAIGQGLHKRGHRVTLATLDRYQPLVHTAGLEHARLRPDSRAIIKSQGDSRQRYDVRRGPEHSLRSVTFPAVEDTYRDLLSATEGADFLAAQSILLPAPMVAERRKIGWAPVYFAPGVLNSRHDPPLLPPLPWLHPVQRFSPVTAWGVNLAIKRLTRSWFQPFHDLRERESFPRETRHPILDGLHSTRLNLALFSELIGERQPDWPQPTVATGFCFYDEPPPPEESELVKFIEAGSPPLVATLGTAPFRHLRSFFETCMEAARRMDRRVVLLTGGHADNRPQTIDPSFVFATDYARYSMVFPRAAAIVHSGAIGALAEAMRAGKPMLVVPAVNADQPDNGRRAAKLGSARTIALKDFTVESAVNSLSELLRNSVYAKKATEVGAAIRAELGVENACDALEAAVG